MLRGFLFRISSICHLIMTSKTPKSLEVPIGLETTPYFWWFLMNIPPYPSCSRENQTYPSAQGHCVLWTVPRTSKLFKILIHFFWITLFCLHHNIKTIGEEYKLSFLSFHFHFFLLSVPFIPSSVPSSVPSQVLTEVYCICEVTKILNNQFDLGLQR